MSPSFKKSTEFFPNRDALFEQFFQIAASTSGRRIPPREAAEPIPLSFAQQRLWFLDQAASGNSVYNIVRAFRLTGRLDVYLLEKCLNEIVRRHESLRTIFTTLDGQPFQVITPACTLRKTREKLSLLRMIVLSDVSEPEQDVQVQQVCTKESQRPFDLARWPLFRVSIVRLGEEESVLLLVMHHSISDGWSIGVFLRELAALYEAFSRGQPSPLPDLPVQYADFAVWQRAWLQGEVLEKHLSYWKRCLEGAPPVLELPTDRLRPARQTFRGARDSLVVSRSLSKALKELSQREGATLFMTLLAAFKVLLHRYTGQDDILVGTPIANRNQAEATGLIGVFVNTLALRTELSGNLTFRELLTREREVCLGAYAHQDVPFEKLVEKLHPKRNLGHSPLFQVMLVLQNAPGPSQEFSNLRLDAMEVDNGTAKFDVTLILVEEAEQFRGTLEYNTDLFDAVTIKRMIEHFQTLLEGIIADPDQRLSDLPLLTEAEYNQLLVEWNDTETDYPQDKCIHELFEAQVELTPDAVAVVFEKQQLTYRELNVRANRLAHHLQSLGVGPEVLVGIYVERSLEMIVGLLGILKAGGAYVPLDPAFPKERVAYMLQDARVPVLLTQECLEVPFDNGHMVIVKLDRDWGNIAQKRQDNSFSRVEPDTLAYVIYTSGSTGRPKGVQISHRALVNCLYSTRQQPGLTAQDCLLAVTTISFDIAALELFLPLIVGARIILVSRDVAADGSKLLKILESSGATVMQATPATWRMMLAVGWKSSLPLTILCGGEALPKDLAEQLLPKGEALWNLYGPTETTIWSALSQVRMQRSSQTRDASECIGPPIANTQLYVLDHHLQPVPIGVAGELYIGGIGLARGYLNRPELTAEKFIPNPFRDESGTRLYKTGDLARYLPDGNIEFLGRVDHQVKIRGFRIELGEIEVILTQHAAVRQAVVITREDTFSNKRLVAYVAPNSKESLTISELRSFLKQKLPDYMVPSNFVLLDALPLTPNGKVDRHNLPVPDQERLGLENAFVLPRTPIEELLVEMWMQILGLDQVGIHDDFFELGGHSLLATRLIAWIRRDLNVELPLRELFELPTVSGLAVAIVKKQVEQEDSNDLAQLLEELERFPKEKD